MAEAIGLGASVLAFITISAQLSKGLYEIRETVKDAPKELIRLQDTVIALSNILSRIHNPEILNCSSLNESLWQDVSKPLNEDLKELQYIALKMERKKEKLPLRLYAEWFLKKDRVESLQRRIQADIGLLGSMQNFFTIQQIRTTQLALRNDLSQARNVLVTKRDIKAFEDRISSQIDSIVTSTRSRRQPVKKHKSSILVITWRRDFRTPLGLLKIECNYGSLEEGFLSISYSFVPATWLSGRGLEFTIYAPFGRGDSPKFVQELTTTRIIPEYVRAKVELSLANFDIETLQDQIGLYGLKPNDLYRDGNIMHHLIACSLATEFRIQMKTVPRHPSEIAIPLDGFRRMVSFLTSWGVDINGTLGTQLACTPLERIIYYIPVHNERDIPGIRNWKSLASVLLRNGAIIRSHTMYCLIAHSYADLSQVYDLLAQNLERIQFSTIPKEEKLFDYFRGLYLSKSLDWREIQIKFPELYKELFPPEPLDLEQFLVRSLMEADNSDHGKFHCSPNPDDSADPTICGSHMDIKPETSIRPHDWSCDFALIPLGTVGMLRVVLEARKQHHKPINMEALIIRVVRSNKYDMLQYLMENFMFNKDLLDRALVEAYFNRLYHFADLLIQYGADIDTRQPIEDTILKKQAGLAPERRRYFAGEPLLGPLPLYISPLVAWSLSCQYKPRDSCEDSKGLAQILKHGPDVLLPVELENGATQLLSQVPRGFVESHLSQAQIEERKYLASSVAASLKEVEDTALEERGFTRGEYQLLVDQPTRPYKTEETTAPKPIITREAFSTTDYLWLFSAVFVALYGYTWCFLTEALGFILHNRRYFTKFNILSALLFIGSVVSSAALSGFWAGRRSKWGEV